MIILVDTCVILDALQRREPFAEDSEAVCLAVASRSVAGFVPAKSAADLYYILHRSFHSDAKTRKALKKLFLSFGILDTTAPIAGMRFLPLCRISKPRSSRKRHPATG